MNVIDFNLNFTVICSCTTFVCCIDYETRSSTEIRNILPVQVYNQLRRTNIFQSVKQILEQTASLAFERYSSQKYIDFWNKWKTTAKLRSRNSPLIKHLLKYIKYVSNGHSMQTQIYYQLFKYLFKNDENFKRLIQNIIHQDFVVKHNKLIKQATHDKTIGMKNAILGIVHYTTREQYQRWRYQVCFVDIFV